MNRRLLITGVAGFIGRHVAAEALQRGYHVTGIDRQRLQDRRFEFVEADIRDQARMMQVLKGQDCVLHLAAITSNVEFWKNPLDCYEVNVQGFLNIVEAAVRGRCQRFVYASSAAVYLDGFSEEMVIDFRRQGNHYAKTKLMNEMVAKSYEHVHGLRATGLRFFNVYGKGENAKGDYASIVTIFLNALKKREPLVVYGDGTQSRDLIYVEDAARVTLDLLERGSDDIYNVGTGNSTTYTAIARMLDPNRINYIPNPLRDYQHYTRAETTRLRRVLRDYEFVDLKDGVRMLEVECRGSQFPSHP
jgi:nucleoside-diphosphate-sugar epimerase